jgi:hypothetical protein
MIMSRVLVPLAVFALLLVSLSTTEANARAGDVGRACGKSCISADKTCHKGRGCACNAEEVCAR